MRNYRLTDDDNILELDHFQGIMLSAYLHDFAILNQIQIVVNKIRQHNPAIVVSLIFTRSPKRDKISFDDLNEFCDKIGLRMYELKAKDKTCLSGMLDDMINDIVLMAETYNSIRKVDCKRVYVERVYEYWEEEESLFDRIRNIIRSLRRRR